MSDNSVISFALIFILIVSNIVCYLYYNNNFASYDERVINLIKKVIISNYRYITSDEKRIFEELRVNVETGLNKNYAGWYTTDYTKYIELCEFSIKLLQYYAIHNDQKYLDIVNKLITWFETHAFPEIHSKIKSSILGEYELSNYMIRFLVIYEVIVVDRRDNNEIKTICHNFIIKYIPKLYNLETVPSRDRFSLFQIYGSIARLLSNYLNNSGIYNNDIKNTDMEGFKNMLKSYIPATTDPTLLTDYNFYYGVCYAFNFWKEH
ncbi:uncharacterized protein LOC130673972 [Microplitis mediator]|uniref:uncharacterized protein LOC130673972 n=1 Tax=Microplitis mediator TaxID=375433 RepID=UPI002555FE00|nr:uncharacterized protein LOC130673972 [Microplitis mediator]